MSGWWSAASASAATRLTKASACAKSSKRNSRSSAPSTSVQLSLRLASIALERDRRPASRAAALLAAWSGSYFSAENGEGTGFGGEGRGSEGGARREGGHARPRATVGAAGGRRRAVRPRVLRGCCPG